VDQGGSSPYQQLTSGQDTWSARCGESRTPGAASGSGKRNGRKADTAPRPDSTREAAASRTFAALDHYLWQLTYKWACFSHHNKPKSWIIAQYYGRFNPASRDRWIFGNRDSGVWLPRFGLDQDRPAQSN
jgi:hypothetical protein